VELETVATSATPIITRNASASILWSDDAQRSGDRARGDIHHDHRQYDRDDHDLDVLGEPDRGDDRIDREDEIDPRRSASTISQNAA